MQFFPREELHWGIRYKWVLEKYTRLVKDMYHQCETVGRCAAGNFQWKLASIKDSLSALSCFPP